MLTLIPAEALALDDLALGALGYRAGAWKFSTHGATPHAPLTIAALARKRCLRITGRGTGRARAEITDTGRQWLTDNAEARSRGAERSSRLAGSDPALCTTDQQRRYNNLLGD